jgi:hypothetical protein
MNTLNFDVKVHSTGPVFYAKAWKTAAKKIARALCTDTRDVSVSATDYTKPGNPRVWVQHDKEQGLLESNDS